MAVTEKLVFNVTEKVTEVAESVVAEALGSLDSLKRSIVETLPEISAADSNTIYMVPITGATGENKYNEYMLINGAFEKIGDSSVDLTDYTTKEFVAANYAPTSTMTTATQALSKAEQALAAAGTGGSSVSAMDDTLVNSIVYSRGQYEGSDNDAYLGDSGLNIVMQAVGQNYDECISSFVVATSSDENSLLSQFSSSGTITSSLENGSYIGLYVEQHNDSVYSISFNKLSGSLEIPYVSTLNDVAFSATKGSSYYIGKLDENDYVPNLDAEQPKPFIGVLSIRYSKNSRINNEIVSFVNGYIRKDNLTNETYLYVVFPEDINKSAISDANNIVYFLSLNF